MDLLAKLARATDTKGYPDDKDPEHWRTINHSHVHLDANGNVDGGASQKFNGNQWTSQKHPHNPQSYNKPAPAPAVTTADLKKAWDRVRKYHVAMNQARGLLTRKTHAQNMLDAINDYVALQQKADPAVRATHKPGIQKAIAHAQQGLATAPAPKPQPKPPNSPQSALGSLAQATSPTPQQNTAQGKLAQYMGNYKQLQQALQNGDKNQVQALMQNLNANNYNALSLQEKKQLWHAAGSKADYINTINQANSLLGQAQVSAILSPGATPTAPQPAPTPLQNIAQNVNPAGTKKHPFPIMSPAQQASMKVAKTAKDADKDLRPGLQQVWSKATPAEREAAFTYSYSYKQFQEPLRGGSWAYGGGSGLSFRQINWNRLGVGTMGKKPGEVKGYIENLTSIINKSSYNKDIRLERGTGLDGIAVMFGCSISHLQNASNADLQRLVGKRGTDPAFTSCGSSAGTGLNTNKAIMHIDCPAGTKMIYVEPFAAWGGDAPYNAQQLYNRGQKCTQYWDGKSPQKRFGSQDETLIQRGTTFQITKAERINGQLHITMQVVSQDPEPLK